MTAILRSVLIAALVTACIPSVAPAQDTSTASLLQRVELLERSNNHLEGRVRELESLLKGDPSQGRPLATSIKWRDLANWRRLRRGMGMDEVRALLGEPARVDGGFLTYWRWPDASVHFVEDKLHGWSEPKS